MVSLVYNKPYLLNYSVFRILLYSNAKGKLLGQKFGPTLIGQMTLRHETFGLCRAWVELELQEPAAQKNWSAKQNCFFLFFDPLLLVQVSCGFQEAMQSQFFCDCVLQTGSVPQLDGHVLSSVATLLGRRSKFSSQFSLGSSGKEIKLLCPYSSVQALQLRKQNLNHPCQVLVTPFKCSSMKEGRAAQNEKIQRVRPKADSTSRLWRIHQGLCPADLQIDY